MLDRCNSCVESDDEDATVQRRFCLSRREWASTPGLRTLAKELDRLHAQTGHSKPRERLLEIQFAMAHDDTLRQPNGNHHRDKT